MTRLDQYKPLVLSLNLTGRGLQRQSVGRVNGELLSQLNSRYDRLCARAAVWYKELQIALLSSSDTVKTADHVTTWLSEISTKVMAIESLNIRAPRSEMTTKYDQLQVQIFKSPR